MVATVTLAKDPVEKATPGTPLEKRRATLPLLRTACGVGEIQRPSDKMGAVAITLLPPPEPTVIDGPREPTLGM